MIATPFASKWGCEKGSVEREGVSSLWAIVFAPYYVPDLIGWARRLDQSLSNDWTLHIFGNYNKTESLRPFYQESSLLELINKSRLFVEALPSQVIATENTDWITANMSKAQWKFYDNLMKKLEILGLFSQSRCSNFYCAARCSFVLEDFQEN